MNQLLELESLKDIGNQIKLAENNSDIRKEVNQILQSIYGAIYEFDHMQEDSEQFISDVIEQSRQRLSDLLDELRDSIPKTLRSYQYDTIPDELFNDGNS